MLKHDRRPSFFRVACLILSAAAPLVAATPNAAADRHRSITLEEAFESSRFVPSGHFVFDDPTPIVISPDGSRYAFAIVRGDPARDGVRLDIYCGNLLSLDHAVPRRAVELFTRALGPDVQGRRDATALVTHNPIAWLDNNRIGLFWHDNAEVQQVVAASCDRGDVVYLTQHNTDVDRFVVGPRGRLLFWASLPPDHASDRALERGFSVTATTVFPMLAGLAGIMGPDSRRRAWFVVDTSGESHALRIAETAGASTVGGYVPAQFSSDGNSVIVAARPSVVPNSWRDYQSPFMRAYWTSRAGGLTESMLQQVYLVDLQQQTTRRLLDAPLNAYQPRTFIEWSPDGRSILIGPTHLSIGIHEDRSLRGVAFTEVVITSGEVHLIPFSPQTNGVSEVRWISDSSIEIDTTVGDTVSFVRRGNDWIEQSSVTRHGSTPQSRIRLQIEEDANHPPVLVGYDRDTAERRVLFSPNPRLTVQSLPAEVQILRWRDRHNRQWRGRLYVPRRPRSLRLPLVIQTNAEFDLDDKFSLYGPTDQPLGPAPTAWLAQSLASEGILVLQAAIAESALEAGTTFDTIEAFTEAYGAAAEELVARGWVDRDRVGLMGFSNRALHVQYALAFSEFPFAAGVAIDGISGSYSDAMYGGWDYSLTRRLAGQPPFGEGLEVWLERSPTFNAERVRAPLLFHVTDSFAGTATPVFTGWEMFSRLRQLGYPAELFVAPNITRGSHGLQNPSQLLTVQRRTLAWWLFWLKREERSDLVAPETYSDWQEMLGQRDHLRAQPRPPRLDWSVQAAEPQHSLTEDEPTRTRR